MSTKEYFIGVDYDEWKPETYRGVTVGSGLDILGKERFYSGDFQTDYKNATEKYPNAYLLSSVNHYMSDAKIVI